MSETEGTESAPPEAPVTPSPDESGHEDVSGGETTPQSGAPEAAKEDAEESTGGVHGTRETGLDAHE